MSLVNLLGQKSKTPSVQTLGVLLFGLLPLFFSFRVFADCTPEGVGELAVVDRIYDGDTLKLEDGRHIRVLGINAPEIDHGREKTGQALGEEARAATESFFKKNKHVRLYYDVQRVDHYERTLAHVYDSMGNSLSAYLLRKGLGFHVAIPPNLSLNGCLHDQEVIARRNGLGVWSNDFWKAKAAANLSLSDTGFQRVVGRIVSVNVAQSVWLELDGNIVIKITPSDKVNFRNSSWTSLKGKIVEVRGWVTENNQDGRPKTGKKSNKKPSKALVVQPRIPEALDVL